MDTEKENILAVLRKRQPLPSSVFVHASHDVGKFDEEASTSAPNVQVSTIECTECCHSTRSFFEETLRCCAVANGTRSQVAARCDNACDFVRLFGKIYKDQLSNAPVLLVFKRAEKLRQLTSIPVLPLLLKFAEFTSLPVTVLFLSSIPWELFHGSCGLEPTVSFMLPRPSKEQLLQQLMSHPPSKYADLYQSFCKLLLDIYLRVCCDENELKFLVHNLFCHYVAPIVAGEIDATDSRKLWKNIEPRLKQGLEVLYLGGSQPTTSSMVRPVVSGDDRENLDPSITSLKCKSRDTAEVPLHSKYLLIAAYLASHNPVALDKRYFVKGHGKIRRKHTRKNKDAKSTAFKEFRGPKAFPLNRLVAIYHAIVDEKIFSYAEVMMQIRSLTKLGPLVDLSGSASLTAPRFKCCVTRDYVEMLSRSIDFEINAYLHVEQ